MDGNPIDEASQRTPPESANAPKADRIGRPRLVRGQYRLLSRIGSGRLGAIYEACDEGGTDLGLDHRVAVQVFDSLITEHGDFVEELRRGYASLRAGQHPNIVRIVDFGRDERLYFLVMERLEGVSLRFVLNETGALPFDEATAVIRAVGDALEFLHTKGLTHGRISPDTVFVTFDYRVKLLDLMPTRPGSVALSDAGWLSPAFGPAEDARDDVYGLACLAYEIFTGRHPFNACTAAEAKEAGLRPLPIETLSAQSWYAIANGLAFDRDQRTPSVSALLRDLDIAGTERLRAPPERHEEPDADPGRVAARPERSVAGADDPIGGPLGGPIGHSLADSLADSAGNPIGEPPGAYGFPEDLVPRRETAARKKRGHGPKIALAAAAVILVAVLALEPSLRTRTLDLIGATVATVYPPPSEAPAASPPSDSVESMPATPPEPIAAIEEPAGGSPALPSAADDGAADAAESPASREEPVTAAAEGGFGGSESAPPDTRSLPVETESAAPGSETEAESSPAEAPVPPADAPVPPAEAPGEPAASGSEVATAAPVVRFEMAGERIARAEGSGLVRVTVSRTGDAASPASVLWWTGQDTAVAGEDYADFGVVTEEFAAGETMRVLHVPLVDDRIPEPAEHFIVYLGRHDAASGELLPLASTRVEITDDD